jgi:hypothetical protein
MEIIAEMLKQAGKHTWHQERVVRVTASGSMAGGAAARVALTAGLKVVVPQSVLFIM